MSIYAEIAVDAPVGTGRTFSYSVPGGMDATEGHFVLVPFGSQLLHGVIFQITEFSSVPNTRDISQVLVGKTILSPIALQIARWMSEHYLCTLFQAANVMFPVGLHRKNVSWISVRNPDSGVVLSQLEQNVFNHVSQRSRVNMRGLLSHFGKKSRPSIIRLINIGILDKTEIHRESLVKPLYRSVPLLTKLGKEFVSTNPEVRAHKQMELLSAMKQGEGPKTMAEARKIYGYSVVKSVLDKCLIEALEIEVDRDPLSTSIYDFKGFPQLTISQNKASSTIASMLKDSLSNPRALLLHGVTGSGKTEVYIEAVKECVDNNKRVIILVPEIALTPQTIERFASRFVGQVAVLHSGLSDGERHDQWWKIRDGNYRVVIGSRSAIFAPQPDLGLVIIDEEHEWAYKNSESVPKYHARDVAMQLAGITRAVIVLGTATPDVETYLRAKRGRYCLSELPNRYRTSGEQEINHKSGLAQTKLVDMRDELKTGNRDIFSRTLAAELKNTLEKGEQAVLFVNRRGASSFMQCRSCGYVPRCTSCDVSLTCHTEGMKTMCHYCGRSTKLLSTCRICSNSNFGKYGIGTQLVEERVKTLFPDYKTVRWDRDSARTYRQYKDILARFRSGEYQVMVGTQVIAKGHDLPMVTLVGVVSADVGLNLPEFRASERVFQLICQVSGRAGRGHKAGQVVIQTYQPEHYAITAASDQNYTAFFDEEIRYRHIYKHPPYSRIIKLMRQDTDPNTCEQEANRLSKLLQRQQAIWGLSDTDIIGPTPSFPSRVRGHYRWHILLRGPNPRKLLETIGMKQVLDNDREINRVSKGWIVDVDPVTFT